MVDAELSRGSGIQDGTLDDLCDASSCTVEEAIALASKLARTDPLLDVKLARRLLDLLSSSAGADRMLRTLEILGAISTSPRIVPLLVQLLRDNRPRVVSKAALLIIRCGCNANWFKQLTHITDPRVQANAIEALWGVDSSDARALLWASANSPHNRIAGNAVLGLYRIGELRSLNLLLQMAAHTQPGFRATAGWAMGQTRNARFKPQLLALIKDEHTLVRRNALRALRRLHESATQQLDVKIWRAERQANGVVRVHLLVCLPNGEPVRGLVPTQIMLLNDSVELTAFSLEEKYGVPPLAAGFVLPVSDKAEPWSKTVVTACIERLKQVEPWTAQVLRYSGVEGTGTATEGTVATRTLRDNERRLVKLGSGSLAAMSGWKEGVLGALKESTDRPGGILRLFEAIHVMVTGCSAGVGSRHVLVLAPEFSGEAPDPLRARAIASAAVSRARAAGVSVHAVLLPGATALGPLLHRVCEQTGGALAEVGEEDATEVCGGLFKLLHGSYELRYQAGAAPVEELRIQVHTEAGAGQAVCKVVNRE